MKNELRTELKSNLLADRLEELFLAIKPHFKLIGFSLAAIIAAAITYAVVQTRSEKASAKAWSEFYFAGNQSEKIADVYRDNPTTTAGLWAKQKSADELTAQAFVQVYLDRDMADRLLEEARAAYRTVQEHAREPLLICRATYGLAQTLDSEGNAIEAAREYKKILSMPAAHREMKEEAQRRIEFIESENGLAFYEWYRTHRPSNPVPIDLPKDLNKLPDLPDLDFSTPSTSSTSPSTPDSNPPESNAPAPTIELPPIQLPADAAPPAAPSTAESPSSELNVKPPTLEPPL